MTISQHQPSASSLFQGPQVSLWAWFLQLQLERRDTCVKRQETCVSHTAVGAEAQAHTYKHTHTCTHTHTHFGSHRHCWYKPLRPSLGFAFLQINLPLLQFLSTELIKAPFQEPTAGLLTSRARECWDTCSQIASESSCPAHLLRESSLPPFRITTEEGVLTLFHPASRFSPLPSPGSPRH